MRESQRGVRIQEREKVLGNNIVVSPDQIFLGLYSAAPCQRKRTPPHRYWFWFSLVCPLQEGRGGGYSL